MLASIVLQVPLALFPAADTADVSTGSTAARSRRAGGSGTSTSASIATSDCTGGFERGLPPEHLFGDLEDMPEAVDALHAAMVDARPNARAGDLHAGVAEVLSPAWNGSHGRSPPEGVRPLYLGIDATGFPCRRSTAASRRSIRASWPALLAALPALPEELQFRFVGRDLVLVDVHADLVLDILKDALPAPHHGLATESRRCRHNGF